MDSRPESSENIPAWFHRYAIDNERQYAALQQRIAAVDTRITGFERRLVLWIVASNAVAAGLIVALTQALDS